MQLFCNAGPLRPFAAHALPAALRRTGTLFIPLRVRHRLENPGEAPLYIVEVQSGDYLGEDDIERFEDRYNRG